MKKNPIKKGRGPKGKGFGMELKFPLDDETRWAKKVKIYNNAVDPDKALDPKKDKQPGPAGYSMICNWKGKTTKKNADKLNKLPNHFYHTSTGPKIGIYHQSSSYL